MLLSLLVAATAAQASLQQPAAFCGTPEPGDGLASVSRPASVARSSGSGLIAANISVPVYVHAIASNDTGLVSETVLEEQFRVLHDVFGRYGIAMTLAGITRTVNASWSDHAEEVNMKTALRRGDYGALNLYVQELYPTLGRCFYPVASASPGSRDFVLDGCQVDVNTVPGGDSREGNDRGLMAVHEVGHWFGLAHTFTGGCYGGDQVDDTPAQATSSWDCTVGQDTCPDLPGVDPIYNFMNYQADDCWNEFTPGQVRRMQEQWSAFRASGAI
ncbi:Putative peptidase M43, pregnancy-associated plasma-A [Colletotrichum destructivum]|uniref:Peptidase M43, pregnancy-associated plasma-A n=1 Tax=Colletotrichum destructivum TaxID=34406 RepID=A0AAX4IY83_9PEZI|nr:Putative peptidase M43, pregnancy-associated plasma-A [Colletotrichum destructivum]